MRGKPFIRLLLVCIALAIATLVLATSMHMAGSACQEKAQGTENESNRGKLIWENLSHQFFTSF